MEASEAIERANTLEDFVRSKKFTSAAMLLINRFDELGQIIGLGTLQDIYNNLKDRGFDYTAGTLSEKYSTILPHPWYLEANYADFAKENSRKPRLTLIQGGLSYRMPVSRPERSESAAWSE